MATTAEVRDRELDRTEAEAFGWSAATIDAELPTLFTDREWEVMATDPAFGYVLRCGHPAAMSSDGGCYSCEADAEAAYQMEEHEAFLAAMTPAERTTYDEQQAAWEAAEATRRDFLMGTTDGEEYSF